MKVQVEFEITPQRIADLVCTGIEGGEANHWLHYFRNRTACDPGNPWYSTADFWEQKNITIEVAYDDGLTGDPVTKMITEKDVHAAMRKFAEQHPTHFRDFLDENEEAYTGDTFLQLLILGDVIYE